MKALILAAGLGTRMMPLTENTPKALVKIYKNETMLDRIVYKLIESDCDEIVINVHHFADQIIDYVNENYKKENVKFSFSDERKKLLDTGGAVKKAQDFFKDEEYFLVHNVDIYSGVNLEELEKFHLENNPLTTLVVNSRQSNRILYFDLNNDAPNLCGWEDTKSNKIIIKRELRAYLLYPFSGIQIVSSRIFDLMQNQPDSFSIIDFHLELCDKEKIIAYRDKTYWRDMAKKENFAEFNKVL